MRGFARCATARNRCPTPMKWSRTGAVAACFRSRSMPQSPLPVTLVAEAGLDAAPLDAAQRRWAADNGFTGQRGRLLALPGEGGALAGYLFGIGAPEGRPVFVAGLAAAALAE